MQMEVTQHPRPSEGKLEALVWIASKGPPLNPAVVRKFTDEVQLLADQGPDPLLATQYLSIRRRYCGTVAQATLACTTIAGTDRTIQSGAKMPLPHCAAFWSLAKSVSDYSSLAREPDTFTDIEARQTHASRCHAAILERLQTMRGFY